MRSIARATMLVLLCASAVSAQQRQEQLSESYRGSRRNDVEYQKVAPFKVFDNLYYVGPGFVSVWVITTSDEMLQVSCRLKS